MEDNEEKEVVTQPKIEDTIQDIRLRIDRIRSMVYEIIHGRDK